MSDQEQEQPKEVQAPQPTQEVQEKAYEPLVVQKAKQSLVEVSDEGMLKATTIEGQFRIAQALYRSKMVPKSYESAEQVFAGMQFAIEMGLKPFSGLRNIAMINGTPSLFGELPLALCRKTGQIEFIREYIIDKEYNRISVQNKNLDVRPWAGVCQLKRKNEDWIYEGLFTMEEAKEADLLNKKFTPWHTYPKIMLMRRARSQVLKQAFPEALQGLLISEFDHNYIPEAGESVNVTHQGKKQVDVAKELNEIHS